jgi:cytochrome P450
MSRPRLELAEVLTDPFGTLKRIRGAGWIADSDFSVGVLTYDAVRDLLTNPSLQANFPQFLRSFGVSSGPFYEWMAMSPLNRDGQDHVRWRSLMSRTFTPRRVEQIRPFLVTAAHELIDAFAPRGRCEFMGEFADAYPSLGLCELIGVPKEDRDRFRGWANTIGLGFNPVVLAARIQEVDAALVALVDYTGALAEKRRADPRDDLVTKIAQAAQEDGWSVDETRGAIAGLVFAGHETTKNQLGWMIAVLADHPDVWDAVAAGDTAPADVIEELMRFRSAVSGVGRTVAQPVERDGERLEPGTNVFLSLWSADADEAAFPKAETFAPAANRETPHMAFGHGSHFCLGAALARAELQEGLAALAKRITCPKVGDGATWKPAAGINGPDMLPITFDARAR